MKVIKLPVLLQVDPEDIQVQLRLTQQGEITHAKGGPCTEQDGRHAHPQADIEHVAADDTVHAGLQEFLMRKKL